MIEHICPFCNVNLSSDNQYWIKYYSCNNILCVLGEDSSFSRYTISYLKDAVTHRSIILNIDSIFYRMECEYSPKVVYVEKIERILSKILPNEKNYLSISVFKLENFIFSSTANVEEITILLKRLLNLRAFL